MPKIEEVAALPGEKYFPEGGIPEPCAGAIELQAPNDSRMRSDARENAETRKSTPCSGGGIVGGCASMRAIRMFENTGLPAASAAVHAPTIPPPITTMPKSVRMPKRCTTRKARHLSCRAEGKLR